MIRLKVKGEPVRLKVEQAKTVQVSGGGNVSSAQINTIVVLDRAEYDALAVKDAKTLYLIRG
jgi:hypothetical protein